MYAVRVHEYGSPDRMKYEEVETPTPGTGQVRVKIQSIGVNYADTYERSGLYKKPLPAILGSEAAGVVDRVGNGVENIHVGDRITFVQDAPAYAEYAIVPAARALEIPAVLSFDDAAAVLLQGLTAHYLCLSTYPLQAGQWTLIHAAAGGAGQLTVQVAKIRGAHVIGTVSTEEKAQIAREVGADEVVIYTQTDFVAEVKRMTGGKGLPVVYDSVGKDTYEGSMNCLATRGMLVLWGNASGPVPPIDPLTLSGKGSLYMTRPTLRHYIAEHGEYQWRVSDLFKWMAEGKLRVRIDKKFSLKDAADAHRYIESRASMGKVLLVP